MSGQNWCGALLGAMPNVEIECNLPKGHDGDHQHIFQTLTLPGSLESELSSLRAERGVINLRALVYYKTQYEVWVGECLETGHIITADDSLMASEMIVELLKDESSHALTKGTLQNLFSNPAEFALWKRWCLAAPVIAPEISILVPSKEKNELALVVVSVINEYKKEICK